MINQGTALRPMPTMVMSARLVMKQGTIMRAAPVPMGTRRPDFLPYRKKPVPIMPKTNDPMSRFISIAWPSIASLDGIG